MSLSCLSDKFKPGVNGVTKLTDDFVMAELINSSDIVFERIYLRHHIFKTELNKIYSVRDKYGIPHATLELCRNHVINCFGKDRQKADVHVASLIKKFILECGWAVFPHVAKDLGLIYLNNCLYDINNLPRNLTVKGDIDLSGRDLTQLPDMSGLRIVGDFIVSNNKLKNLDGSPHCVDGDYMCDFNELESIDNVSDIIRGTFNCSNNKLRKVSVVFKHIGGDFIASNNLIADLDGVPYSVGGTVDLSANAFQNADTGKINPDCNIPRHILNYKETIGINMDDVKQRLNTFVPKNDFEAKVMAYNEKKCKTAACKVR
ncbi:MAG: hypothetical protein J6R99_03445 [Alphaproteobacteria bacterium]|nr:hypothetical protein [Alphaproteobacteria bacterium]